MLRHHRMYIPSPQAAQLSQEAFGRAVDGRIKDVERCHVFFLHLGDMKHRESDFLTWKSPFKDTPPLWIHLPTSNHGMHSTQERGSA